MKRLALLLFVITTPVMAQDNCGNGLPCGPIPWDLPQLPELESPTPFPTIEITATLTPSPGPTATPSEIPTYITMTPYPTPSPFMTAGGIEDSLGTIAAIGSATPFQLVNSEGTPFTEDYEEFGSNAGDFFGYVRGLSAANFGVLSPLFVFVLSSFVFILLVKSSQFILPILAIGFGFIRKIVQLILDFIPG